MGTRDFLVTAALFLVAGVLVWQLDMRSALEQSGRAHVADGDTITLDGERIRLLGIDAPELRQTCSRAAGVEYACGSEARLALVRLVEGREVVCVSHRRDRYDRLLAHCRAGRIDLGRAMVEQGWAVAADAHGDAERAARRAGRGIWAGAFENPRDWRANRGAQDGEAGLADAVTDRLRLWLGRP